MRPSDHEERERALDPTRSFIVQAPAGSGKTELLIQRYLRLLAEVDHPGSVVAITFTRKAAAEMQRRVLQAFASARGPAPNEEHKQKTWALAKAALARAESRGWELEENPRRLAIQTIDSLCLSIVSRMPWLSRLGPRLEMVDDASDMFADAGRRTVALLEDERYARSMECLLLHVDNKQSRLAKLLAAMLERRDQWLRHLGNADPHAMRERFEGMLRRQVEDHLKRLRAAAPPIVREQAAELARHAAANLSGEGTHPELQHCRDLVGLPGAATSDLPQWQGLAKLLLTDGRPRKTGGVNKRLGFPPTSRLKTPMCALLEALLDHEEFCSLLDGLRKLPDERFDDAQWEALEAMLEILPAANEQLRQVFGERGTVDFSALNQAALHALGEDHLPTDLAFALDARIQHLLVDEFQDTSHSQMELLRKLTREWSAEENRTLFLVGDPMQSIYRFREAEVGLFLQTMRTGLPTVDVESLELKVNFRSRSNIVDWVNDVFPAVFAKEEDAALGAVCFAPSACASQDAPGPEVQIHPFWDPEGVLVEGQPAAEAARVRAIVEQARANNKTVAVLARARGHLPHILAELRKAGQRYRAIEIDPLSASPAVLDLMALTAALLHSGDRVSWLAILRAPWCGLTLADLHALTHDRQRAAVPDLLADAERLQRLSEDGRRRARSLASAMAAPRQRTLRAWVEGVWLRLGGPATVRDEAGLVDAEAYFDLIEKLDRGCDVDLDLLRQQVNRLFAAPDPGAGEGVEVMTIHKAKGLEFDVVVLPGLGRTAKTDDEKLMLWLENPSADGGSELLLAPMRSAATKENAIYKYVQKLESEKEKHERERLLYVAATRARSELHLLGAVRLKDGVPQEPAKNTLLRLLWPAVQQQYAHPQWEDQERPPADAAPNLRRLSADWAARPAPQAVNGEEAPQKLSRFRWEGQRVRLLGTVVHDVLHEIGREGAQAWTPERIRSARPRYQAALRAVGVLEQDLADAADVVERALIGAIEDERGRWILDGAHDEAWSEVSLAGLDDGRLIERRIDRTFIDKDGVRWVIDFKTSDYAREDVDAYLRKKMEEYRAQMEGYRSLYRRLERRRVRIGLYFPLLGAWREYEESAAGAAL